MVIVLAYLTVILIWSTTPLAIQFSQQGLDFYTALVLRMWLAAIVSLPVVWLMKQRLVFTKAAFTSYIAGSVGVYGAMMSVYWGSLYIPSGLISVLYGLSPMLSGAIAFFWLKERELTPVRVIALLVALSGLSLVVSARISIDENAWRGILGTLLSVLFFAWSAVWVKKANAGLHPMVQTSGTLWVSSLIYLLTLPFFGLHIPDDWSLQSKLGLGYLVIFGSIVGFMLYFFILKYLSAARVTLITLVAPVLALSWGNLFNGEEFQRTTLQGAVLLLTGLALYQWHRRADVWLKRRLQKSSKIAPALNE